MVTPLPLTGKELWVKLREVLEKWPLYRELLYSSSSGVSAPPRLISLYCPICKKDQIWKASSGADEGYDYRTGFRTVRYICKNCDGGQIDYFYYWGKAENQPGAYVFFRAGQYPPLEEWISPALERQLDGQDLDFYKKGLRCRNFNYGIGALAYLRRVVENRMNDVLDLVGQVARESGFAAEELEQIEAVKRSRTFDDKVSYAAKILPPRLRPDGVNPIDTLHDMASEGIHSKSDDECVEIFDKCKLVFEYFFSELRLEKERTKQFAATLRELTAKRSARAQ